MRILFLDIDGVLNSDPFFKVVAKRARRRAKKAARAWPATAIDPDAITRLNKIIEQTGCKIVISSSWRNTYSLAEIVEVFRYRGFVGDVIGVTPEGAPTNQMVPGKTRDCCCESEVWCPRGHEIAAWLKENPVETFVILDDCNDMAQLLDKLVQTDWEGGLQDEHVERAICMLQKHETPRP